MLIAPQISASSIVALGHLNPLIFRPDWLKDKEIVIGSDFEGTKIEIIHADLVAFNLPWGQMQVDRTRLNIVTNQEPLIRTCDFFVKCFQALPETPLAAVGINRDVHFDAGSERARDRVGDVLAPKDFWGDFVRRNGEKAGGMRSLVMEQSIAIGGQRTRIDGFKGWVQVKVEPSMLPGLPHGIFVEVNDHYDLTLDGKNADGRLAADIVGEKWDASLRNSEQLIDRIMGIVYGT
jgi:hypothetical protein